MTLSINLTISGVEDLEAIRTLVSKILDSPVPFRVKVVKGGLSNKMFLIVCESGLEFLVRIYGRLTNQLVDRKLGLHSMRIAQKIRGAPLVYAEFNNGLAYSYIQGSVPSVNALSNEHVAKLIAVELARFHSLPMSEHAEFAPYRETHFSRLRNWIQKLPTELTSEEETIKYQSEFPTTSALLTEVALLEQLLDDANSPVVLCHNDLLAGNIVISPDQCSASFIDMEYCGFGHAAYDIGNHFCEFAGIEPVNYAQYPSLPAQRQWIRWYLQELYVAGTTTSPVGDPRGDEFSTESINAPHYASMNGHNPIKDCCSVPNPSVDQLTDEFPDLNDWLREANYFALVAHLTWAIWAVIRSTGNDPDIDYLAYAIARIREYERFKPIVLRTFSAKLVPTDFSIPKSS